MVEILSDCLFDVEHECNVLTRLSIEFEGEEHRTLVYEKLLPMYCKVCPHLKQLESKSEED